MGDVVVWLHMRRLYSAQKSRHLTVEREAMSLSPLVSAAINRFDGSFYLGEDAQFVCHV